MNFPGKLFRFFIYSNLFIALCAVVMVCQTYDLLLHTSPPLHFILFVFFASVCSYSFHWYLTPAGITPATSRTQWLSLHKNVHLGLFFTGLAGSAISAVYLLDHWYWLLLSVLITFFYSAPKIPHPWFRALRRVALAKTIFLAFAWMYVTTVLPLQVSEEPWQNDFYLFVVSRFFLIYAICIIFDYRDREYDKSIGIRSLITWLSEKKIDRLFIVSLLIFFIFTGWLYFYNYSAASLILLLIPGILTAILYPVAKRNFSDMLYYFVLDGVMALSAILTLFL